MISQLDKITEFRLQRYVDRLSGFDEIDTARFSF